MNLILMFAFAGASCRRSSPAIRGVCGWHWAVTIDVGAGVAFAISCLENMRCDLDDIHPSDSVSLACHHHSLCLWLCEFAII